MTTQHPRRRRRRPFLLLLLYYVDILDMKYMYQRMYLCSVAWSFELVNQRLRMFWEVYYLIKLVIFLGTVPVLTPFNDLIQLPVKQLKEIRHSRTYITTLSADTTIVTWLNYTTKL